MIWWEDELEKHFPDNKIDDLSDFDVTQAKTFYIAINGFTGQFGSEEFDDFSESSDVYYMVVNISEDEDMAYLDFLKYAKGKKGQNLVVSEEPFLKDQEKFKEAGINFIMRKGLNLHNYDKVGGIHYAGNFQIRYRTLNKTDENNPEILDKLREIFRRYEKEIGIDLQFQAFAAELANLPGDYARPKGAIILAEVVHESAASPKDSALSANFDNSRTLPQIAGCVALRPFKNSSSEKRLADSICEMKRLYVEPAYKGLEIGSELVRRIIIEAQKQGYKYMRLDTLSTMDKAQRLYEKLGFYDIEPYIYNPIPGTRYMELKL